MMRLRRVDKSRSASDCARFGDPIDSCLDTPLASTLRHVNLGRVARRLQVPFVRCDSAIDIYMAWSFRLWSHRAGTAGLIREAEGAWMTRCPAVAGLRLPTP